MKNPKRGEIFWVNLDPVVGTEVSKVRPGLIVSDNISNENSSRVIVAPITSNVQKVFPFEVLIPDELEKPSKVLIDQIRALDKKRLSKFILSLHPSKMKEVDKALKIVLSLD